MEQVNGQHNAVPEAARSFKSLRKGKAKLPEERRRVILSARVLPSTLRYLQEMHYPTTGRALDVLVKAIQHGGIKDMLADRHADFSIVNLGV